MFIHKKLLSSDEIFFPLGENGSPRDSIAFQNKAHFMASHFMALQFIGLADVIEVGLLPLWEKVPDRADEG